MILLGFSIPTCFYVAYRNDILDALLRRVLYCGHSTQYSHLVSHIFTAHTQERPFMNFRLKFWHRRSIPWSRFPYRARYFGDTRTFSDDFCIRYAECPPYFYFRSSWPIDLESVSRDAHLAMTVSTKFEVDTTIRCLVIALLLLIRYVTLWPWPLTFWLWSVVIHGGSRVQHLYQVWRSYVYPLLGHEFWHLP